MNYYELLGIKEDATQDEIKEAYKREIKKWHPDISKDANAVNISMKLNEAKDVLLDKDKREEYDLSLKEEKEKIYKKYSNNKSTSTYTHSTKTYSNKEKDNRMLTKWEYFKEYLKYSKVNIFRKALAIILVSIETVLCSILKVLVIAVALLCFYVSDIIIMLFYYLFPFIMGFLLLVVGIWVFKGKDFIVNNNIGLLIGSGAILGTFVANFILVIIGNLLLSGFVFDLLYNKLDITLFKLAVGYKE